MVKKPLSLEFLKMALSHSNNAYTVYCDKKCAQWPNGCKVLKVFAKYSGYILSKDNVVLICFKGTFSPGDMLIDANIKQVSCKFAAGKLHKGFLDNYQKLLQSDVLDALASLNDAKVYVTGHSLGAAIGCICAIDLLSRGYDVYAAFFALPKVGDEDFASSIDKNKGSRIIVMRNTADVIPLAPPGLKEKWFDLGNARYIDFRDDRGKWMLNHSLSVYHKQVISMLNE